MFSLDKLKLIEMVITAKLEDLADEGYGHAELQKLEEEVKEIIRLKEKWEYNKPAIQTNADRDYDSRN